MEARTGFLLSTSVRRPRHLEYSQKEDTRCSLSRKQGMPALFNLERAGRATGGSI